MLGLNNIISNIPPEKNQTQFRRNVLGSGTIILEEKSIEADSREIYSLKRHPQLGQYTPLNFIRVDNRSNQNIRIRLNQDERKEFPVLANQSETNDQTFHHIEIINLGNEKIEQGDLTLTVARTEKDRDDDYIATKKAIQGFN